MTRATSREAFKILVESGALRGQQATILNHVIEVGPGTAAEMLHGTTMDRNRNLARARFTELNAKGLIREIETRKCKITGRHALVWEATDRTKPLNPDKAKRPSGETLAATLVRICDIASSAADVIDSEGLDFDEEGKAVREAIAEARKMAARA